jgi:hypothetical protein
MHECFKSYYVTEEFRTFDNLKFKDEMGRACSTNREKRNPYRILAGEPGEKRPLGRPRCRRVDNIKIDLREIGCDDMDWIDLAQDWVQ